jgi:hypothetical protein
MNIDMDGDPQDYGPRDTPGILPLDSLEDGGWRDPTWNKVKKQAYDAGIESARKQYEDLLQQRADLDPRKVEQRRKDLEQEIPSAEKKLNNLKKQKADLDPKTDEKDRKALDQQIASAEKAFNELKGQRADLEPKKVEQRKKDLDKEIKTHTDLWQPGDENQPKNLGQIFWDWYGLISMTPDKARRTASFQDPVSGTAKKPVIYHPDFMKNPGPVHYEMYEDVFGRFPMVQVAPEPGPGFFVSTLASLDPLHPKNPQRVNPRFPEWDQRSTLVPDAKQVQAYGALSGQLKREANLYMQDKVLAIRLDLSTDTLVFPFLDAGGNDSDAVAECSWTAFTELGGSFTRRPTGQLLKNGELLLLYLAFPNGQTPAAVLSEIGRLDNADEFPIILAFIANASAAVGRGRVGQNPLQEYERWKKLLPERQFRPDIINLDDVIAQGLMANGFIRLG